MGETPKDAVARIVSAFGQGRLDDYFACFRPDANFVFYTSPRRLDSVDEYRALWATWVDEDGFRVVSCSTTDTDVREHGDVAIVTHVVSTRVATNAGEEDLLERETIVLAREPDGSWRGIHEHLSPAPGD